MSSARNSREYRSRQKAGEVVLKIRVPEIDLIEALVEIDYIDPSKVGDDNREALSLAVQELLAFLISTCPDE
jgi:hypothetical protein